MTNKEIHEAQRMLLTWMSHAGSLEDKRMFSCRLPRIRKQCEYLAKQFGDDLDEKTASWNIFYPLLYSGVVEHIMKDFYIPAPQIAIVSDSAKRCIYTLPDNLPEENSTEYTGIYIASEPPSGYNSYKFELLNVLKHFPSLEDVVKTFCPVVIDLNSLTFTSIRHGHKKGVAKTDDLSSIRYFANSETLECYEIPSRTHNPDALNIAHYYDNAINGIENGFYNTNTKVLSLHDFGLPILLFRSLLIHCFLTSKPPHKEDNLYIFENITNRNIKEINRILCNSICYE